MSDKFVYSVFADGQTIPSGYFRKYDDAVDLQDELIKTTGKHHSIKVYQPSFKWDEKNNTPELCWKQIYDLIRIPDDFW